MKKTFIYVLTMAALMATSATAQSLPKALKENPRQHGVSRVTTIDKMDGALSTTVRNSENPGARRVKGLEATAAKPVGMIVTVNDAQAAAAKAEELGGKATIINENTITVKMAVSKVREFVGDASVVKAVKSRKLKPSLDKARVATGVDKIHNGTGLDTPYTGKGVIVGVIDQGFQYSHNAFKDAEGNSRFIGYWNQVEGVDDAEPHLGAPTMETDGQSNSGHATHVTGIAAGSVSDYGVTGMAPEASILGISSNVEENMVLDAMKWMTSVADEKKMPLVMNMSFGGTMGPHDGTTEFDIAADKMLGAGRLVAAAMGNEQGKKLHAKHIFLDDEPVLILSEYATNGLFIFGVYEDDISNGEESNFNYTPVLYNWNAKNEEDRLVEIEDLDGVGLEIDMSETTGKAYCKVMISVEDVIDELGLDPEAYGSYHFGLKIEPEDDSLGKSFNGWCDDGSLPLQYIDGVTLYPDDLYCVGESSASIPQAIGVGAYTTRTTWTNAMGEGFVSEEEEGYLSSFSSLGPSLGDYRRPTVVAPGAHILSALNRFADPSDDEELQVDNMFVMFAVDKTTGVKVDNYAETVTQDNKDLYNYYGLMGGTSMSTPAVAGILALWLQAYPTMTPAEAEQIIAETSIRDEQMGDAEWNSDRGYGKIDAYEGLKAAIQMNIATGIGLPTMTDDKPVTINRHADTWQVLYNVPVSQGLISIYNSCGQLVGSQAIDHKNAGEEQTIGFGNLTKGVYLVQITTPSAVVSRKVMVP